MALLAVCSAKGSPGASTLAIGLAALWPRPALLVDLDPAGSDLVWRYRNDAGQPLDPDCGLLSIGAALRRSPGGLQIASHQQTLAGGQPVVVGVTHPDQVTGLGPVWPALTDVLLGAPGDIIADCGRVVPGSPTVAVLGRADAVLFVVRPGVAAFAHLRERLRAMATTLHLGPTQSTVFVALVCSAKDRRVSQDLQRLLDADGLGVQVIGPVVDDPAGAAALGGNWNPRVGRSLLVRSIRSMVPFLAPTLQPPPPGGFLPQ